MRLVSQIAVISFVIAAVCVCIHSFIEGNPVSRSRRIAAPPDGGHAQQQK